MSVESLSHHYPKKDRRSDRIRNKLDPLCTILVLFVRDRREPKEIGRMMGKPDWWVRRRIQKAK